MKDSELGVVQADAILGIFTSLFGVSLHSRDLQTDRNCLPLIRSCCRGQKCKNLWRNYSVKPSIKSVGYSL